MNSFIRIISLALCWSFSLFAYNSWAATFGTYDPRSLAMGGTGVSQANIDHAAYYNPALLSVAQEDDDYSLLIPTVGLRVYDPEKFIDALEDHQDGNYETKLSDSVDAFNATPSTSNAQVMADDAQRLFNSFKELASKELDFEAHAGVGTAIPSKGLGFAITASGRLMGGLVLNITDADKNMVQHYIDAANEYASSGSVTPGAYPEAHDGTNFRTMDGRLTSKALIRGAMIVEGGLSISHEFESLDNWSIGITPKSTRVSTYDYEISVENSELDEDKGKLEYEDTNLDIGVAKRISEGWKFGMGVKNVIEKEYKTTLGNSIVLKPNARAGISHHTNWTTIALDLDLTENERLGLTGEKTRYAALGMEFDLALIQLRLGARHNLSAEKGREATILSAGVGVYFFGIHLDAGVAKNDEEVAAAIQLGIQY